MTKIRLRLAPAGRQGWPEIFTYVTRGGVHHVCAPAIKRHDDRADEPGEPYTLCIRDLAKYEALARSGALHWPPHTGPRVPVIDNGRMR